MLTIFLSLKHLEAIVGLFIGLISILLYLRDRVVRGEGERDGGTVGRWSSQNTHNIYQLSSPSYMGAVLGAAKQLTIV
jgi:hypothetical protein